MSQQSSAREDSPWELRVAGQYERAVALYTKQYEVDGVPSHLYNRGSIYVETGEYARALEDFELLLSVKDPSLRTDGEAMYKGICYWYLNQPAQSVESWRRGLDAPYTDAAGGVRMPGMLLYAALRLEDSALQKEMIALLRKHARRKLGGWPGPIVPFLLGKIDQAELLDQTQHARHATLVGRWQCQAHFYIAVRARHNDDDDLFKLHMTRCAESPYGRLEHESYLARWEVQRHFPSLAFG